MNLYELASEVIAGLEAEQISYRVVGALSSGVSNIPAMSVSISRILP